MSYNAPGAPDYRNAAQQTADASSRATNAQTQANRPNQSNAFGASTQWSQDANGNWTQSQALGGPLGQANGALQQQAANALGQPLDFGGLGALGNGDAARSQAINAAFGQATARLDPQWQQRQEALGAQLANQGLDPTSQAYRTAMQQFGAQRNDAYGSAMNSAIEQGTAAGNSVFQNNLAARQQGIGEMMQQRNAPLQGLQGLQALMQQQGFNAAGRAESPDFLNAAGLQNNADFQRWAAENGLKADALAGLGKFLGSNAQAGGNALGSIGTFLAMAG